jgi:hypothetical protein
MAFKKIVAVVLQGVISITNKYLSSKGQRRFNKSLVPRYLLGIKMSFHAFKAVGDVKSNVLVDFDNLLYLEVFKAIIKHLFNMMDAFFIFRFMILLFSTSDLNMINMKTKKR